MSEIFSDTSDEIDEMLDGEHTLEIPQSYWQPLDTLPYDENVLFLTESENVYQDIWYDCDKETMLRKRSHGGTPKKWAYAPGLNDSIIRNKLTGK